MQHPSEPELSCGTSSSACRRSRAQIPVSDQVELEDVRRLAGCFTWLASPSSTNLLVSLPGPREEDTAIVAFNPNNGRISKLLCSVLLSNCWVRALNPNSCPRRSDRRWDRVPARAPEVLASTCLTFPVSASFARFHTNPPTCFSSFRMARPGAGRREAQWAAIGPRRSPQMYRSVHCCQRAAWQML